MCEDKEVVGLMIWELYGDTIDNKIYPNVLLGFVEYTQDPDTTNGIPAHCESSVDSNNLCMRVMNLFWTVGACLIKVHIEFMHMHYNTY